MVGNWLTMAVDDTHSTPLMPLDAPILKVSRPVAACSRCRNAKIKCDGKLPACSSCEKNGRAAECTSTNDQFARGKERSYVSTLETRLDKLQAKLEECRARKPSVISLPDDDMMMPPSRSSTQTFQEPATPNTSKAMRRKERANVDDLVSDFGFLSINSTSRDFYGFTQAMSYARLILWACSRDPLPEGMAQPLPARHTATSLIQHYLNNIFALLPVFDEASFYASFDKVYSHDAAIAEPLDHYMVRLVLAIASASLSEQRGDQLYMQAIGHVCAALNHAEAVFHPGAISSVQALVLLTEYATLNPHCFDSWSLIGAASRAMVDLGLHQDPPKGTAMAKGKLELRRRVFYCIYTIDRSTSLVQTRAFSFSDDSTKVKIPYSSKSTSPTAPNSPEPPGSPKLWLKSYDAASSLINLRQLQSLWYHDLFQSSRQRWEEPYPYIWNTCDAMRKWYESLPTTLSPSMRAFFDLELLYSYVYVLSQSARVVVVHPFAEKLKFEHCIQYANLMSSLVSDNSYTAPFTFYDAMRVYMVGRQFLDVLQHNIDALLNGHIPPHPEVTPTTAPPPQMPVASLPPGETIQRFNTMRSIKCIKQIADCLSRFGVRWGYMSWSRGYQRDSTPVIDELNRRLAEIDTMTGLRQPSLWPGSTPSVSGSIGGRSNSDNMSTLGYSSTSPPVLHPGPAAATAMYQTTPDLAHAVAATGTSPNNLSPPPYHPSVSGYMHSAPLYDFGATSTAFPPNSAYVSAGGNNPSQQFASWQGYGAPALSTGLDDENGVPPEGRYWGLGAN